MMHRLGFAMPILPGKAEEHRRFVQEIADSRREEYGRARTNLGIKREMVWIQRIREERDILIAYWEVEDPERVVRGLAESTDPFDEFFREGVLEYHGIDLNKGVFRQPPELMVDWQAS